MIKFSINKTAFQNALKITKQAIGSKVTIPALTKLKIEVEEKGIKFKECYQIGPTIGTHVGPETFGFIAVEKAKN